MESCVNPLDFYYQQIEGQEIKVTMCLKDANLLKGYEARYPPRN